MTCRRLHCRVGWPEANRHAHYSLAILRVARLLARACCGAPRAHLFSTENATRIAVLSIERRGKRLYIDQKGEPAMTHVRPDLSGDAEPRRRPELLPTRTCQLRGQSRTTTPVKEKTMPWTYETSLNHPALGWRPQPSTLRHRNPVPGSMRSAALTQATAVLATVETYDTSTNPGRTVANQPDAHRARGTRRRLGFRWPARPGRC